MKSGGLAINGPPAALPNTYRFVVSAVTASGGYIIGTGVDLTDAMLSGTDLSGITLTDTNMQNAQLTAASLVNVRSGGIRGTPAVLPTGYTMVRDNSSGGYIVGQRVNLSGADLTNCVLSNMDVSGANLSNATLTNAKTGPNLRGPPALFPSTAYRYVVSSASGGFLIGPQVDILGANLSGSDLSGFSFAGANILNVDFSATNLVNVKSGGTTGPPARLPSPFVFMTDNSFGGFIVGPRADLSGANLTNCRFTGLDISGAAFTNTILTNVKSGGGMIGPPAAGTLPDRYRYVADTADGTGGYIVGPGVDLSGASLRNLTSGDLNGAYFTSANLTRARLSGSILLNVKSGGITGTPTSLPTQYAFIVSASGGYIIGPSADLTGANLDNTVLTGLNITNAELTSATFINTRTGGLIGPPAAIADNYYYIQSSVAPAPQDAYIVGPRIDLSGAVLSRTNLTNVDLSGSNLTGATFEGTVFTNTNIYNANLTGLAPFTNTQRIQLLKNKNNRNIAQTRTTQCLGGEIDMIAATSAVPNTTSYDPIFDYMRYRPVDILTVDNSGNSNLSAYTGRAFYIPSGPAESFYVDVSATAIIPVPGPYTQYYYDIGRNAVIETLTGNTIRSIWVGGRPFLVFGGSVMGLLLDDDVYNALGFPGIYKQYSYYGVRNLILPEQIAQVNTVVGNGQISLNWVPSFSDGKPRLGYVIEYSTQQPSGNFYVPWTTFSEQYALTNATITGLINGVTYYFRVAAINAVGTGAFSETVNAMPGTVPDTITTLFVNGSVSALTLEWDEPYAEGYPITSYNITYREANAVPPPAEAITISVPVANIATRTSISIISAVPVIKCSYQLGSGTGIIIRNGVAYDVKISATNSIGSGAFGAMASPDPALAVAGNGPGKVAAADISWNLIISGGGGGVRISWLPLDSGFWGDLPIYTYSIQAVAGSFAALNASANAGTIPDASWNVVPRTLYAIQSDYSNRPVPPGALYTVISGLTNGTAYKFRIAAISGVGRGAYSDSGSNSWSAPNPNGVIVPGSTPVRLLTSQLGTRADFTTGAKITFFWNKPASNGYTVLAYKARYRISGGGGGGGGFAWTESPEINVPTPETTINTLQYRNYAFTGLMNGTDYEFEVSAKNLLGWSDFSEPIVGTPRTVPNPVSSITSQSLDTSLYVAWSDDVSDGGYPIIGYRVQYATSANATANIWSSVDISGIYNMSVFIPNLFNGQAYSLRVLQQNNIGYSAPSQVITKIPGTVSAPPIGLLLLVGPHRITAYWQPPIDVGTNPVDYYYMQYKTTGASDDSYIFLTDTPTGPPKQLTEISLKPNPPDYDGYTATIDVASGTGALVNGVQYSVRIAAVTRVGIGAFCVPGIATPGTVPSQIE